MLFQCQDKKNRLQEDSKGWSNIIWMYNKGSCDTIWTYNFEQFSNELVEVLVLNKDEKSTAGR